MQIVIDIPDETYEEIKKSCYSLNYIIYGLKSEENRELFFQLMNAILDGTPLPKHHGRLIDANALQNDISHDKREAFTKHDVWLFPSIYNKRVPTIIEADKEVDE